jgi:hypothetical protein
LESAKTDTRHSDNDNNITPHTPTATYSRSNRTRTNNRTSNSNMSSIWAWWKKEEVWVTWKTYNNNGQQQRVGRVTGLDHPNAMMLSFFYEKWSSSNTAQF